MKDADRITGAAHDSVIHDSAVKHVTGRAEYTDDITEPTGCLHAYIGTATVAKGHITALDLSAVRAAPGVVAVLTEDDIPGHNDISPTGLNDEPIFSRDVQFHGQPLFAVVAETRDLARRACTLAKISYDRADHATDIDAAEAAGYPDVTAPLTLARGDAESALAKARTAFRAECA